MLTCSTCHSQVPESSRACQACGHPVTSNGIDAATMVIEPTVAAPTPSPSSRPTNFGTGTATRMHLTSVPKSSRFQPGSILVGRYQIIGLLGKGGMGEVYRANDLTLDQAVALKFLPEGMASNSAMLSRFHGEVRIARQVSHPNICRVYDIGEVDGQLFLSMEYVDGEDLGSLLRRIGRLPSDKAVEFARRMCAGLAAAHDRGVLHRDLKPANIMIDGQGKVVIMDFGLAGVAEEIQGLEIKAGTPAYMSPEQLAGREVSIRSDIYALGVVLYEMFTGKRPFECGSMAELVQMQYQVQTLSPSMVVKDMDPAVESVIVRCLSPDPKNRPSSALAVAAALPGGDPLAQALAAGETPSPEVVAASGENAGIRPVWAVVCGAVVLVLLIVIAFLGPMMRTLCVAPVELPPDALALKAREITQALGYTQKPADSARGFLFDVDYLRYLQKDKSPHRWDRIANAQPAAVVFWYRQGPRALEPMDPRARITFTDPPQTLSGMVNLQLDPKGRLSYFQAVPPQVEDAAPSTATPVDWKPLFASAGLDMSKFTETEPKWTPLSTNDTRVAWQGVWPEMTEAPLRVEAAAWRGRVVYFDTIGPWTRPIRMQQYKPSMGQSAIQFVILSLAVSTLFGGCLLARYNLRRGRGDRRGAMRVTIFAFIVILAGWLIGTDYFPTAGQVVRLFSAIGYALFFSGAVWVGYMALEPYVRRHWPGAIVSWTRLMAGGIRDPLVGRDILIGVAFGTFWGAVFAGSVYLEIKDGGPNAQTMLVAILSPRLTLASLLAIFPSALIQLLVTFFLLFVARLLLRREWLAAVAFVGLYTGVQVLGSTTPVIDLVLSLMVSATIYVAMTRFGFVTYVTGLYVFTLVVLMPITIDFSAWYSGASALVLLTIAGLAAYGMHAGLAGRNIIEDDLL